MPPADSLRRTIARHLRAALTVASLCVASAALAADGARPGWADALLAWLLTPEHLAAAGGLLLAAVGALVGGRSAAGVVRRRRIYLAAKHAFLLVEDLVAECRREGRDFPYLSKALA